MWQTRCSLLIIVLLTSISATVVELGYARYQSVKKTPGGIQAYLGIRFAATPRRWERPSRPQKNRKAVISASAYGSICAQAASHGGVQSTDPTALGSEDCLFLNVWKPVKARSVPVVVWIHGGGYGQGNGRADPHYLYSLTGADFVFVSIQYRLGALGFLSSAEVYEKGSVNVGLLDQECALEWVQEHIASFGGDPKRVTIWGESAGAGSVMQQILAYGGTRKSKLFTQAIASSPYLPMQRQYNDSQITKSYEQFAEAVNCSTSTRADVFACLQAADSRTVKLASNSVSQMASSGQWSFLPVIDGVFARQLPSQQLLQSDVNGESILVGSNLREGTIFVPQDIGTSTDFASYVDTLLPQFNLSALQTLATFYPESSSSNGLYATESERAATLYADTTFNCPATWLADAFPQSYRYQFAIQPSTHGQDLEHYLPSQLSPDLQADPTQKSFDRDFVGMFVSYITKGIPAIASNSSFQYPKWLDAQDQVPRQVSFAETGDSVLAPLVSVIDGRYLTNGADRCDFWRTNALSVPE